MSDPNAPASSEAFRLIVLEFLPMTYHVPDREHKAGNLGGQGEMFPIGNIFAEQAQKAVPSTRSGTSLKSGSYRSPDPIEPDGHERCSEGALTRPRASPSAPAHAGSTMATLFMLCGLPGSGKTSLARRLEAHGALALSLDDWMVARGTDDELSEESAQ